MRQLSFRPIQLSDSEAAARILRAAPDRGCEYTFGNLFIWRGVYDTHIAWAEGGALVVRFGRDVGENGAYLFPVGGELRPAVDAMMEHSAALGEKFTIIAARKEDCDALTAAYGDIFSFHISRDFAEYVYNASDLIELKGKKYHGKRNHLARFREENEGYSFEEITRGNLAEVRGMNDRWYAEMFAEDGENAELSDEQRAVNEAFDHYFELGFSGGFLKTAEGIAGYSMGEPINGETFCVHIEKACYDTTGAYTMINQAFCERFCGAYKYVNREDDVGDEGLRRAKLSYYPEILTDKYVVHIK